MSRKILPTEFQSVGCDLSKDRELQIMIDHLEYNLGDRTLEIGCRQGPISHILEKLGCEAWGNDLGDYEYPLQHFIKGDFLDVEIPKNYFDIAIDISAIHHFGLFGTYGDEAEEDADTKASLKIWESLKPGGVFYLSMDRFKRTYQVVVNFVRQYNRETFDSRIAKPFKTEAFKIYDIRGNEVGSEPRMEIMFAKLRKVEI